VYELWESVERNQCDGCSRGLPIDEHGIHRGDGYDAIVCTAERYTHTEPSGEEATEEVPECPECHVAADRPKCAFGLGGNCPRPRLYGRTKRTQQPQDEIDNDSGRGEG